MVISARAPVADGVLEAGVVAGRADAVSASADRGISRVHPQSAATNSSVPTRPHFETFNIARSQAISDAPPGPCSEYC